MIKKKRRKATDRTIPEQPDRIHLCSQTIFRSSMGFSFLARKAWIIFRSSLRWSSIAILGMIWYGNASAKPGGEEVRESEGKFRRKGRCREITLLISLRLRWEKLHLCCGYIYGDWTKVERLYAFAAAAELFPFTNIALFIVTGIRCDSIFWPSES